MKATGRDHECGAPMVLDVDNGTPRCAVCVAQDPTWTATTRDYGLFRNLVLEVDAMSFLDRQARRRQEETAR